MTLLHPTSAREVGVLAVCTGVAGYLFLKRYEPKKLPAFRITIVAFLVFPGAFSAVLSSTGLFSSSIRAILFAHGVYYAELVLLTLGYRISPFHPLASYPGPFFARLSKGQMLRYLSTGKQQHIIHKLHERYGDVVRIGPNEVSIRHADAVIPVLGLPKGPFWDNRSDPPSLIATRDMATHTAKRRRWNRAFSSNSLKEYEETIREHGMEFIEALSTKATEDIDLNAWMSFFTFDFMGELCFGRSFSMVKDGQDKYGLLHLIEDTVAFETVAAYIPWAVPMFHKLPMAAESEDKLVAFGVNNVQYRMQNVSGKRDLFHYLIDEDGLEAEKPSTGTVISDALVSIIAGSDTTATGLIAIYYYLLKHPEAMNRLRQEIDKEFPFGEEPVDFTKLAHMSWLNACINEALRLIPPLPGGAQKYVLPRTGGKMAGPYFVPENTAVTIHPFSLHRDPRYFSPMPDMFWPDRWVAAAERHYPPGASEKDFVLNQAAYIPFSGGAASCAGKSLAIMELRAVIALLVRHFDVTPAKKEEFAGWENTLEDWFTLKRGPLHVGMTPRKL
ncbi:hypothetical protein PQX77_016297 [Marasmius sp. AFHP31]|nr:hypothetical protein PQX77_016297 [Marasmius sp. AFHP31]